MFAQRLWDVLTGTYPPLQAQELPLMVSLCYYSLTIFSGRLARLINCRYIPSALQVYVGDFVVSFVVHACSLENSMMRRYYGWTGYTLVLFSLAMWFSVTIHHYQCNPRKNLMDYIQGDGGLRLALLRTLAQLAGGLLSYRYARHFWALELTDGHSQRFKSLHCTTDLRVPLFIGFAIEFGGSIVDTFLSITEFSSFQLSETATKCCLGVGMTVLGVDATGFYLNPINASNQSFGCRGASIAEHLAVYWAGPLLATAATVYLKRLFLEITKSQLVAADTQASFPQTNSGASTVRQEAASKSSQVQAAGCDASHGTSVESSMSSDNADVLANKFIERDQWGRHGHSLNNMTVRKRGNPESPVSQGGGGNHEGLADEGAQVLTYTS